MVVRVEVMVVRVEVMVVRVKVMSLFRVCVKRFVFRVCRGVCVSVAEEVKDVSSTAEEVC